jgi:2'-5' RNA ligase
MRIFISVELPEEIKNNIAEAVEGLRKIDSGVKWIESRNLHLTLKFLGWIEDKNLEDIVSLGEQAVLGHKSFKVKFEGAGSFPEGKSPRVFWVGISEGGLDLKKIADNLGPEKREFSAHLTIGRVKNKEGVDEVKEKMKGLEKISFGEFFVNKINVMKSTLTPKGPIYETYKSIKLVDIK